MPPLKAVLAEVFAVQEREARPLAIVLAGHNGSGKSTFWNERLAGVTRMPLVNADRMMMSVLPEPDHAGHLPGWARDLRDGDEGWKRVSQQGVQSFVAHAIARKVPFAFETVFSHWKPLGDGRVESKLDLLRDMQAGGYFVLLVFVGLANAALSVGRVQTRVAKGGHGIPPATLMRRFPRTQQAIAAALSVADASILVDNSLGLAEAFSLCRVQIGGTVRFDRRDVPGGSPAQATAWMDRVSPR